MASSDQLKGYLKQEVQKALGFAVDSPDFDKIMGAFAIAIDKYLKQDVKVDLNIQAKGKLDLTDVVTPSDPEAETVFDIDTKTTTRGNLI